jgi:hypothetical protein
MENIPQVNNATQINSAEFVKLTIYNDYNNTANVTVHTFSSAYKNEVIGGTTYLALGGLLQVGGQNRDLRVTSGDTTIALSGVSGNNIPIVLGTKIRGSLLEVIRGFYDANMVLQTPTYPRFTGIVTSYSINEDLEDSTDNFTVTVSASSYKTVLENRIAGRKTNKESWQFFNSGDLSMDNVYSISGVNFDFGQDPKGKSVVPGGGGYPGNPFNDPDFGRFNDK